MNRSRTRLAAALLLALAGAGSAWWWSQAQSARTQVDAAAQAEAAASTAAAAAPLSAASQAALAALAHPWPVTGWEPAGPGSDPCSRDPATPPASAPSAAQGGRASAATVAQAIQALNASPAPEAQALAAWWPSVNAGVDAAAALNDRTAACANKLPCERQAFGQYVSERAAARDPGTQALATLAARSKHPAVYAMAVEACKEHPWAAGRPEPAHCQAISLEQWAQLDADNAVPWLHLASQALQRQDDVAVAEALSRASQAQRVQQHGSGLLRVAQQAWQALPEPDRRVLEWQLTATVQAHWTLPNLGVVTHYCSNEALHDPNRRPTCEGLAKLLLDQGRLMVERHLGLRLAERLGWPAAQLEPLQQERAALSAAFEEALRPNEQASPCEATRQALHVNSLISLLGEVGLARMAVARSGLSMQAFAEQHALRTQKLRPAAESVPAAAAAAAASAPAGG